ncbi:ATP-binding protein [Mariniblastus fucicola]|uniref:histidine kinase n=1 Tax=Mariniblastus fucicola TaxID=980251 RepID=A0A5B9P3U1_9BACT|nr:ATP-binding protein [Mariniblastus fucicola]QEG21267.1 Autoinducer 2 sensor kinase/phosphatase LuxQ [Mariniblastus fucicola]
MNRPESNTTTEDFGFLPPRYQFQEMISGTRDDFFELLAADTVLDTQVRIELIPIEQFDNDGLFRLEHYFGYASRLKLDAFVAPTDQGFVTDDAGTEYVLLSRPSADGTTLEQLLDDTNSPSGDARWNRSMPSDLQEQYRWMKTLLEAVDMVHALGITQQDFRPSQLIIDGDTPKLICPDLRMFSKPECREESWSLSFVQCASPELMGLIEHDVNNRSDIYSIGVIFYCLQTGQLPFDGSSLSQILSAHLTKQVFENGRTIQSPLMKITERMLEKIPQDRYQSVASILEDFRWLSDRIDSEEAKQFVAGRNEIRDSITVPMFVGREEERTEIRRMVDEVRAGGSRIALISGESGIGKTRLVSEAIREAGKLGMRTFQSEAIEHVGQQPVAPLTKLINNLVHSDIAPTLAEKLDETHEEVHFFFPKFATAIGLRQPENENGQFSKKDNKEIAPEKSDFFELNRLSRAVCSVLSKLGTPHEPAVIWIDDCQWLGPSTIETLRELSRWNTESLLIILTSRTSREQPNTSHIDIHFDTEIRIGPLPDPMLEELVNSMAVALPKQVVETIVRLASGSPFMAEAILREMAETGAIHFKDAQWQVDERSLNRVQASTDATEALLHRLEQIPPMVLEQLSVAAIIGKSFQSSTVSSITGTSTSETQVHLDWARKQRLIWSRPDGSQAFVHDRIRIAMVDQLSRELRSSLHAQLAKYFEAQDGDPIKIALHYDQAGDSESAFAPAVRAAKRAYESSSLSTALQMYHVAWKGVPFGDRVQRGQIAERIGSVLMLGGKYHKSDIWFQRAEGYTDCDLVRARIIMQRSELAFKRGDKSGAVKLLENAMELLNLSIPRSWLMIQIYVMWELMVQVAHSLMPSIFLHRKKETTDRDRMVWKMYSRLAHCYWYTRGKSIVLWAHLAGLNRAETGQLSRELAQAWSEHAPVMGLIPWYGRGANYSARSLRIRNELKDVWGEGQSRNYFSILLYATSRFEHCIAQAKKAEDILMRTGDYWELNIARYQHAAALYRQGNLKEAYELAEQTLRDAIKIGDYQSTGNIIDVLARSSLGKIPFEYIEAEKNRDLDDLQLQPQVLLAEGVYRINNDSDPSQAVGCFERALEIVKKTGVSNCYTSPNSAWLATALRRKIAHERKKGTVSASSFKRHYSAAKDAVRVAQRFRNELPHALREMGYAYADKADQKRARKCLIRSLKLALAQNASYEAALTQQAFERMDARFGWREIEEDERSGNHDVRKIEATVRLSAPRETVSIVSRFDALLDAGRKITSALGKRDILKHTVDSAADMLRGQSTLIVLPDEDNGWHAWESDYSFDEAIILEAAEAREPIIRDHENTGGRTTSNNRSVSVLCCPIVAGKEVVACIYVSNRLIESMFGPNELRIAEFIGNAAGSSLEKETSFQELDELNASLEQKVSDRTRSLRSRTRELELTAQQLRATQHRLEDAASAAEAANRIKSDFLAKMSHEIRTPITAVLGFTQLILRGVISEPEEQLKKIRSIESSGKHLLQLVNDLLDISKIEADKIEIEQIECRPLHLFGEIVESLRSKASEGDNTLKLDLVAPIPSTIQSDPKRLRQVVTNILGNAIKFTSGGVVTLRVSSFNDGDRGMLKLDVIDTGIGMTPEQLKNVFDPFVQADSSITRRFGGTGLGLSISQKLTKALGGEISVVSSPGEGSTFSITVEAGPSDQLELLEENELEDFVDRQITSEWITSDLTGLRILLADDAQTNRDLISLVLSDCGAHITLAENGQEAVDHALGDEEFDIILMDMQMPVLDGYSATQRLRSEGYEGPIYALTANSMKGDREKCMAAGCSDYLTKPIDLNGLVKAMAAVAGSEIASVSETETPSGDTDRDSGSDTDNDPPPKKDTDMAINSPYRLKFKESDLPDNQMVRKFSFDFFKTLDRRKAEFSSSLANRDKEQLASLAHWLKGTSGTVMLGEVASAAKEMEAALRADDWQAVAVIYELIEVYSECATEFSLN